MSTTATNTLKDNDRLTTSVAHTFLERTEFKAVTS
jgi:hypothetical protein